MVECSSDGGESGGPGNDRDRQNRTIGECMAEKGFVSLLLSMEFVRRENERAM